MNRTSGLVALGLVVSLVAGPHGAGAAPNDQITYASPVALPAAWFDPAEATGILIPFMVYYALHDALVKPMPGNAMAPSLAESWSVSPDGLVYEFVLRQGVRFHNGDPVTADDVKFSLERYRGVSAKTFKDRVQQVQAVDPHRVRIQLKDPWPDFLTFYATPATGAAWIVPRKYVERSFSRPTSSTGARNRISSDSCSGPSPTTSRGSRA
jgi:peptide/nickel transport system substrate-binding protein